MSKSLKRVKTALQELEIDTEVKDLGDTRTAADAARAAGCELDQIAKSLLFAGETSGALYLFLTAGGNRVDPARAATLAGEPLGKADAAQVRATTGFAIGGVAPLGHLTPPRAFLDRRLTEFDVIWAAAGTPRHVMALSPAQLQNAAQATPGDFTEIPE